MLIISFIFSYSPYGLNTQSNTLGNVFIEISPVNITSVGHFQFLEPMKVFLINYGNQSSSYRIVYDNQVFSGLLPPGGSKELYISPSVLIDSGTVTIVMNSGSEYSMNFHLNFSSPYLPIIAEICFLTIPIFYFLFLKNFEANWKYTYFGILAAYLILAPFFGQRYDMYFMLTSPLRLIHGINPFAGNKFMPGGLKWAYPPLFLLYGMAVYYILSLFGINFNPGYSPLVTAGYEYSAWRGFYTLYLPSLYFLEKLPLIASTFIIFFLIRKHSSGSLTKRDFDVLWLLNPLVILIGSIWGQFDMLSLLFMILSIVFFKKGNTAISSIFATIGGFIKLFPFILIPYILIKSKNKIRDTLLVAAISLICISIYFTAGNFLVNVGVLLYSRGVPTVNGSFFANGITWQIIPVYLRIKNFPMFFIYLLIPFYIILLYLSFKGRLKIGEFALLFILGFFVFYDFVNPQYFIIPVALYILLGNKKYAIIYSIIPTFYVLFNYSFPYFVNYYYSYNYFSSILGQGEKLRLYFTDSLIFIDTFVIISTVIYIVSMRDILVKVLPRDKVPD